MKDTRLEREEELVPVRAVNAFTFCPRLAWLEHAEGLFAENEHTIAGHFVHRRVDKPGGVLPSPEEDGDPWHSRSLWLSNLDIGVSGKLDLVDVAEDGSVIPVDSKKGKSDEGRLWAPDRVQLTLQAMLLESHGYRVEKIGAWYAVERRRVYEPLTDELREAAKASVSATKVCLGGAKSPAPLSDSPKCFGCSLNDLCLPDELRRLAVVAEVTEEEIDFLDPAEDSSAENVEPVRRVVPPRFDSIPLYVPSSAVLLKLQSEEICVSDRNGHTIQRVGLQSISHVNIYGSANITTPLLRELLDRDIPVCFFSSNGWYRGRTVATANRQVHVREAQYSAANGEKALEIAKRLIADKIYNSRVLLRRNLGDLDDENRIGALKYAVSSAERAESFESLLGFEGNAARLYWGGFSEMTRQRGEEFRMTGRTRRPPRDRVNALLSYVYGTLTKDTSLAVEMAGFDPFCGFFHTNHHGRPSLALDVMEPFRPTIADSVVLTVIRKRGVSEDDFVFTGQQVVMKPSARKALLQAYERRMDETFTHPEFGYSISYRRALFVHARLIARYLSGEIPAPPTFRTR